MTAGVIIGQCWRARMATAATLLVAAVGCGRCLLPRPDGPLYSDPRSALPALTAPRVLVEKSLHRLTLLDGERRVKSYRAAVGGGAGDKVREGDRCTPEGGFYICYKNPQSKYTLSLGLSYPNEEDADRGLRDGLITREQHDGIVTAVRATSQPDWYTPLGGEIMIHGCGSGRDWTAGCVALDDDAIRELYEVLPIGTPVEIRP